MIRKIEALLPKDRRASFKGALHLSNAQLANFEPQAFQLFLQILRRVKGFIRNTLEDAHDLSVHSMLLGFLNQLGFADWIRELIEDLIDTS
jgi:hypothetical protein